MVCERCGSTIPEGQKFCGQCGAPAPVSSRGAPESAPPAAAAAPEQPPAAPAASSFNLRTCLLVGAGCLAILLIGACLTAAFFIPVGRNLYQNVRDQIVGESPLLISTRVIKQETEEAVQLQPATMTPESAPDLCAAGICLSYPAGLGFTAQASTKPAQLEPDVWAEPEHLELLFNGYPLVDTLHTAHLGVYDTAAFREVNPNAGDMLDRLQGLLEERPAAPEDIPLLPVFNAAPMITANVEYLEFEGGSGVRFITQYGQAIWPINNHDLFYAFTGLSADGSKLVTAIMPVANQALPDDAEEVIAGDMDGFMQGYESYIDSIRAALDSALPGSYTPNLDLLDGLMRSVQLMP
jgi:hypothetical protein